MEKISSEQINATLVKTAQVLRSQQSEIATLKETIAQYERKSQAEKIASVAVERGMVADAEEADYAERLAQGDKDLSVVEEVVSQQAAGVPLGSDLQKLASEDMDSGDADVLSQFLLTSEIPFTV